MRNMGCVLFILSVAAFLASCTTMEPASKATEGNLELSIEPLKEGDVVLSPLIYLDKRCIGTVSARKPILYLKPGRHDVRLQLAGYKTWQTEIEILGGPNMQYLHVRLEKVADLVAPAEKAPAEKPKGGSVPK
jgi:hypothetical protein